MCTSSNRNPTTTITNIWWLPLLLLHYAELRAQQWCSPFTAFHVYVGKPKYKNIKYKHKNTEKSCFFPYFFFYSTITSAIEAERFYILAENDCSFSNENTNNNRPIWHVYFIILSANNYSIVFSFLFNFVHLVCMSSQSKAF